MQNGMDSSQLSFGLAFGAGLVSFLSPCMLPLVPIFLAQLVGQSISQSAGGQDDRPARFITFLHAVMFVLGFTLAFVALGATASALGSLLRAYQFQLRQIGGVLLVLIGLYLIGILKLPLLTFQKRFAFHPSRPSYLTSLLIGIIFAIGWTPCISLLLGSILGLGVPFLLLGLGLDRFSKLLKWLKPHLGKIEIGTGVVLILVGVMIYFNWLVYLNRYAVPLFRL